MIQQPLDAMFGNAGDRDRGSDAERAELAAFFRELGLGWEVDPERLVNRLSDVRGGR